MLLVDVSFFVVKSGAALNKYDIEVFTMVLTEDGYVIVLFSALLSSKMNYLI